MKYRNKLFIGAAVLLIIGGLVFFFWNNIKESKIVSVIENPPPLTIGGSENAANLSATKVIAITDQQRAANGKLPALKENTVLDAAALSKANDMFTNQYFEHVSPSGVAPGQLIERFGYLYIEAGENLILGNFASEQEVVQDWMNSPGHRANILNKNYTEIGVAVVKGTYQGKTVWIGVQEFGRPMSDCPQPSDSLKSEIDANNAKLNTMSADMQQKKAAMDAEDQSSAQYQTDLNNYNAEVGQYNTLVTATKALVAQYNQAANDFNACVATK
jgi:uncharacterized protein YkwD